MNTIPSNCSGIHAREWISPATAVFLMDTLVQGLPEGDEDLLAGFDWYFLPIINPDGYAYTWNEDRNWRKTRFAHIADYQLLYFFFRKILP